MTCINPISDLRPHQLTQLLQAAHFFFIPTYIGPDTSRTAIRAFCIFLCIILGEKPSKRQDELNCEGEGSGRLILTTYSTLRWFVFSPAALACAHRSHPFYIKLQVILGFGAIVQTRSTLDPSRLRKRERKREGRWGKIRFKYKCT